MVISAWKCSYAVNDRYKRNRVGVAWALLHLLREDVSFFFFFKELGQLEGVKVRGKGVRYLEEQVIITRQEWRKGRSLEFKVG